MSSVGRLLCVVTLFVAALFTGNALRASDEEKAVVRDYSGVTAAPAPSGQSVEQVSAKSEGFMPLMQLKRVLLIR